MHVPLSLDQEQLRRTLILVRFGLSFTEACALSVGDRLRCLMAISEVEWIEPKPPHDAVVTIRGHHLKESGRAVSEKYVSFPPIFSSPKPFNVD